MGLPFRKAPLPLIAVNISPMTGLYTTPTTTCSRKALTISYNTMLQLDQDTAQTVAAHLHGAITQGATQDA